MQYHVIVRGITTNPQKFIMKLQVKQLDTATTNTIAAALEMYADYTAQVNDKLSDKYLELAVMFNHSVTLLVSEAYEAPEDDVQVLGKQEKGGEQWN